MSQNSNDAILTIAVTSYNYSHFICEALDSVMNQTSPNWKMVICDNGSTDDTLEVIKPYLEDPRVSLVIHPENIGARKNIIYALDVAKTPYCSVLQADDFLDETYVETALYLFEHYPESPFVFFNWHQFMDDSKTSHYHDRLPFRQDRAGPAFISPFLAICNFVPLHLAAFRTECVQTFSHDLDQSPLKQVGEQFILKLLEDEYGAGCYSGTMGGMWRRHGSQITLSQLESGVAILEEAVERHWYIDNAPNPNYINVFMALATLIQRASHISLLVAADWLLHTEGQRYAESYGIPIERERYRLLGMALTVCLKFSTFSSIQTWAESDLEKVFAVLEHPLTKKGLKSFLLSMQALEGDALLNDLEITEICDRVFKSSTQIRDAKSIEDEKKLNTDYQHWINKTAWRERDVQLLVERMTLEWHHQPVLHLIMQLEEDNTNLLADTIDSLAAQYYANWQLTIVSSLAVPDPIFVDSDNLNWLQIEPGQDPYQALNMVVNQIPSDWVCLVKPGVRFEPQSLASISDYINVNTQWHLIYTDDDCVDASGELSLPRFKPSFNLDLLRSSNYIGDVWIKTTSLQIMGGIQALPHAENYDITLKACDFFGEKAIGHIENVLTHQPKSLLNPFDASVATLALDQHLERNGEKALVHQGLVEETFRVEYQFDQQPMVSIIIPNKNRRDLLEACVESIFEKTAYPHFELIIVDNASDQADLDEYYQQLLARYPERITLLNYQQSFNFSAINNMAVQHAKADYVLLLNNDTQIIQADWLTRMMQQAQREDVAIVGAKLIYPDSALIQHAGVVLGMDQVASHPFVGQVRMNESAYLERAMLDQNYSAVSAACMMIRKTVFETVGGFDSEDLAVFFNDLDLCLKVRHAGHRIVWTPYAMVMHQGGASLSSSVEAMNTDEILVHNEGAAKAQALIWKKWLPVLINDPAYNHNLRLQVDCAIDLENIATWDNTIPGRLRVLTRGDDAANSLMNATTILKELDKHVMLETSSVSGSVNHVELARMQADTLFIDSDLDSQTMALLEQCSRYQPSLFKVLRLNSDHCELNLNPETGELEALSPSLVNKLAVFDRVIVSNSAMATLCQDLKDVVVIPERVLAEDFSGITPRNTDNAKPRVAWSVESIEPAIAKMMTAIINATADKIEWIVIGTCPESLLTCIKEHYNQPKESDLTLLLSSLKLNLMVCPSKATPITALGSNDLLLKAGMLAYPVIASVSLETKTTGLTCIANDPELWLDTITRLTGDLPQLQQQGHVFREHVMSNYILDNHLSEWAYALTNKPDLVKRGIELANAALSGR